MENDLLPNVAFDLVTACERPLRVIDLTARAREFMMDAIKGIHLEHRCRSIYLNDEGADHQVSIDYDWLSMTEIEILAAGGEIRTPIGPVKEPNTVSFD